MGKATNHSASSAASLGPNPCESAGKSAVSSCVCLGRKYYVCFGEEREKIQDLDAMTDKEMARELYCGLCKLGKVNRLHIKLSLPRYCFCFCLHAFFFHLPHSPFLLYSHFIDI